jgi:MYXO-CTERM domain-containing protein
MPAVNKKNLTSTAIAFIAGSFLAVSAASADTTQIPDLFFDVSSSGGPAMSFNAANYGNNWANGNGTFTFTGQQSNQGFDLGWSVIANPDPFVIANIVVTNNTLSTQTFSITVNLPVGAIVPSSLIGGSITGTVTDLNGDGATVASVAGSSIYSALIDGNTVATLMDDPFSVSAGSFGSAVVGPQSFGDPIPSMVGPAVNNTIGITLEFTLSAGDAASFTSIFVAEVPGPGGLALLAVAGVVGGRRRRRA